MKQRGRKGEKSPLSVIDGSRGSKPPPPAEFDEYQAAIWHDIVASRPADWFDRATLKLLYSYCHHAKTAKVLNARIAQAEKTQLRTAKQINAYSKLLTLRERESRIMLAHARAMRITLQSINPENAKNAVRRHREKASARPWET